MRTIVALQHRFDGTPDGRVWSDGWADYSLWERYLDVFDTVRVIARVRNVEQAGPDARRADGPQVSFAPVPHYLGPWQFARRYLKVRAAVRAALTPTDAVILRVPGSVSTCLEAALRTGGHPYGVEVVGDPYDVFAPSGTRSVLRPFLRWWIPRNLRRQCAGACAATYVTASALQLRYPPAPDAYASGCSDVRLPDEAFVCEPRPVQPGKQQFNLVFVGTLNALYKAPDVLIEAVAVNVDRGLDLRLSMVGDGKHRAELAELARARGIGDRVHFAGQLPAGEAVRAELDRADLFVLPSHQEGLPRALVEAMARGLACLGSHVGGFPELLPEQDLVPPGNIQALAAKIQEVLTDHQRLQRLSKRNLEKAREYRAEILWSRQQAFYEAVRDATADWQRRSAAIGP